MPNPTHESNSRPRPGITSRATEVYRGCRTTANGPVVISFFRGTHTRMSTTEEIHTGTPMTRRMTPAITPPVPKPRANQRREQDVEHDPGHDERAG